MIPQTRWARGCAHLSVSLFAVLLLVALQGSSSAAVAVDPSFHFPEDDPALAYVSWCHVLPDGKLLAGGGLNIFRLNGDGSRDTSFPLIPLAYPKPVLEPGGGFTVFGTDYEPVYSGAPSKGRRFDAAGQPDPTFQLLPSAKYSEITVFRRDARGGYLVAGRGIVPNLPSGGPGYGLVRLQANGSLDASFHPLSNVSVSSIEQLKSGDWVVACTDISPEGFAGGYSIRRIRPDGRVVAEMDRGRINPSQNTSMIPLNNGKLLVAGEEPMLKQLRRDGRRDPAFRTVDGENAEDPSVSAIARMPDGRVVVGAARVGSELTITSAGDNTVSWPGRHLFRVLPDGALDLSFDLGEEYNSAVYDVVLQRDGKVITADGAKLRRFVESPSPAIFAFGERTVTIGERDRYAVLTVYRSGDVRTPGVVSVSTVEAESTASAGVDYRLINARLYFGRGVWKRSVFVPLRHDHVADGIKKVTVRLSNPDRNSAIYAVDSASIEIYDADIN